MLDPCQKCSSLYKDFGSIINPPLPSAADRLFGKNDCAEDMWELEVSGGVTALPNQLDSEIKAV